MSMAEKRYPLTILFIENIFNKALKLIYSNN